jgi:hypothetical protein
MVFIRNSKNLTDIHRERKRLSPAAAAFKNFLVAEGAGLIDGAMRCDAPARKAS